MDSYYPWASHFITWDELEGQGAAFPQREISRYKSRCSDEYVWDVIVKMRRRAGAPLVDIIFGAPI